MKQFISKSFIFMFLTMSFPLLATAQNNSFVVFLGDKKAMTEDYEIEKLSDGLIKLKSTLNGAKIETISTASSPKSFHIEQQGTKVLSVEFTEGQAKVFQLGKGERSVATKASVVLENNVWSQYILLLAGYDSAKGGKQKFDFFLPSNGMDLALNLEKLRNRTISLNGKSTKVEDYEINIDIAGLRVKIATDENKIPILIEIPQQQVKVIRKDFEAQKDEIAFIEKKIFDGEFTEEEVSFPNKNITLGGTLTVPKNNKKSYPAAVLISGSGSQDRDGSTTSNIYKHIAESLSQAGIAVLRVDDRGIGKSQITKEQAQTTSYYDLISDTRAAIDYLQTRNEIDKSKIFLAGHSEGAGTALYLASEDKRVSAIAVLAGVSTTLDKAVLEQSLYQSARSETIKIAEQPKAAIVLYLLKMFADAKLPENANNPKFAYFRDHLSFNPTQIAEKVKCPVLILQGELDVQVLASHAVSLATTLNNSGNKNVSLRILPNLSHLFTSNEEQGISKNMLYELQIWADETLKP